MAKTQKEIKAEKKELAFRKRMADEMLRLATSGFGLVAALAWNDFVKKLIAEYVEPLVGRDSGMVSLFIYTIIVTVLAVTVTYNLARIKDRLQ